MKIKYPYLTAFLIVLTLFIVSCSEAQEEEHESPFEDFAECLSDSGVKMYGAYWCPHCQNQKLMFGESLHHINYIECSLPDRAGQTEECSNAGIKAYPTWEFSDGSRVEGEMNLQQLGQKAGCVLQ